MRLTCIVRIEEDQYVALCPELDVASQGDTADEAARNLQEACELFLEHACEAEIQGRLDDAVEVRRFEAGKRVARTDRPGGPVGGGGAGGGAA